MSGNQVEYNGIWHVNPLTLGQPHKDKWARRGIHDAEVVYHKDFIDMIVLYIHFTDIRFQYFTFPITKKNLDPNPITGEAQNLPFDPPENVIKEVRYYFERILYEHDKPTYKQSETFVFLSDDVFRFMFNGLTHNDRISGLISGQKWLEFSQDAEGNIDYEPGISNSGFYRLWNAIIENMKDLLKYIKNSTIEYVPSRSYTTEKHWIHVAPPLTKEMYLQAGEKTGRQWIEKMYYQFSKDVEPLPLFWFKIFTQRYQFNRYDDSTPIQPADTWYPDPNITTWAQFVNSPLFLQTSRTYDSPPIPAWEDPNTILLLQALSNLVNDYIKRDPEKIAALKIKKPSVRDFWAGSNKPKYDQLLALTDEIEVKIPEIEDLSLGPYQDLVDKLEEWGS